MYDESMPPIGSSRVVISVPFGPELTRTWMILWADI